MQGKNESCFAVQLLYIKQHSKNEKDGLFILGSFAHTHTYRDKLLSKNSAGNDEYAYAEYQIHSTGTGQILLFSPYLYFLLHSLHHLHP